MTNKNIFLTGATGLVGSYLLKLLLELGYKVYALVRSNDKQDTEKRLREILNFWDEKIIKKYRNNLVIIEGNITKKNLGLSSNVNVLLKNKIEEIFHCAAVVDFNWPLKKIREVNVKGTKNVLDLALSWQSRGQLKKINHISTAYVCGNHVGVFKEDDLDIKQKFNTSYTQSKFEAEKLVEKYRKRGMWIDIFRPALVVGESISGKTPTFRQSFYQILHVWNLKIFDSFPGKNFFANIVAVDELCQAMLKIAFNTTSKNRNYHLFPQKKVSLEQILKAGANLLKEKRGKFVSIQEIVKTKLTAAQKMILKNNLLLFNDKVKLDSCSTGKFLKKYKYRFTDLSETTLSNLLNFTIKEGFLKKYAEL